MLSFFNQLVLNITNFQAQLDLGFRVREILQRIIVQLAKEEALHAGPQHSPLILTLQAAGVCLKIRSMSSPGKS